MKLIAEAPKNVLREDGIVVSIVGADADGETKVYQGIGKTDSVAPFIVIGTIPFLDDDGVYGDDHPIITYEFQTSCWGRTEQEAWILADACDEALMLAQWTVDPYVLMKIRREGMPTSLPDRDTDLRQVQARYRARFSR